MGVAAPIPVLDFDDGDVPSDARFELFHDTVAPLFDTSPIGEASAFGSRATDYLVDDLVVSRLRHRPQAMRRTMRHLSTGASDALAVQVHLSGTMRGRSGDHVVRNDVEHIGIIDLALSFSAVCSDVDVIWVVVPRHRLRGTGGLVRRIHVDSPRGRVVASAVRDAVDRLEAGAVTEPTHLADRLADAISSALEVGDFRPSEAELALVARDHVRAHLDDLALDAASLMGALHCSRATLFRLFKDQGGIATYVRDQRLDRCLDDLLHADADGRTVGSIATRWGFENPSHFHRIFTERFGTPPSMLRHRAPKDRTSPFGRDVAGKILTFHQWASLS